MTTPKKTSNCFWKFVRDFKVIFHCQFHHIFCFLKMQSGFISTNETTKFGRRQSVKKSLRVDRRPTGLSMFLSAHLNSEAREPVSLDFFVIPRPFTTSPCCTRPIAAPGCSFHLWLPIKKALNVQIWLFDYRVDIFHGDRHR